MNGKLNLELFLPMLLAVVFFISGLPASSAATTLTQTECRRCHGTDDAVITAFHHGVRDANNWSCTQCHKPVSDGTGGYTISMERDCTVCHGGGYHTEPAGKNRDRHHNIRNSFDYGCLHCHPAVQDADGSITIVLSRDCFFCHQDGQKQWREVKWLQDLPTPTAPDGTASVTDISSKFHDTMMYEAYEVVDTPNLDKAITVRLAKDASATSKVTLSFYVFEAPGAPTSLRIYPYLIDGNSVDTSGYKDCKVSGQGWVDCDVSTIAGRMKGFTWMKFRVTAGSSSVHLSEGSFQILRSTTTSTGNQLPTAAAGVDIVTTFGSPASFSGSGSFDPDGTIVYYLWNFGDGVQAAGINASHAYAAPGTYLVSLTVADDGGAFAEDFMFVTVKDTSLPENKVPLAAAGPDATVIVGEPVKLSAASSLDIDGTLIAYLWDFGDGTGGSGVEVTKTYAAPGIYPVSLTVADNLHAISFDTAMITVLPSEQPPAPVNVAPVAEAGPELTATTGQAIALSSSGSTDVDGTIASYTWSFGDGTTGAGAQVSKTYAAAGTYTVTLTVTDNAGAVAIDTTRVIVTAPANIPPIANAGADRSAVTGQSISFSSTGSSDSDGSIVSYIWNFGDGTTGSGSKVTKIYSVAGTYPVTLTVTDNVGAKTEDSAVVTVMVPTYVPADAALQLSNLRSSSATDGSGSAVDVTSVLRDGNITDTVRIESATTNSAIAMKINKEVRGSTQVILRVYVSGTNGSGSFRVYPYAADGTTVNTSASRESSIPGQGWKEVDVTSIAGKMRGFGWMKFRITGSGSQAISEGNFVVR